MSEATARLGLPFLAPAQAQKHVTHNAALDRLDLLVQAVVEALDQSLPPPAPPAGQIWATGAAPAGDWTGHPHALASLQGGGWVFLPLVAGWRVWVRDPGAARVWTGSAWTDEIAAADLQNLDHVGINAGADATNRLTVASAAALFTHAGAGHQIKLNKAAPAETGSLMFQTGFSGRAEMGLAGSDDFAVKVSADGALWTTALSADRTTGRVGLPAGALLAAGTAAVPALGFSGDADTGLFRPAADQIGFATGGVQRALLTTATLQVNVPVTGTAVTQSAVDATAGRLLQVGAAGILGAAPAWTGHADSIPPGVTVASGQITEQQAIDNGWPTVPGAAGTALRWYILRSGGEATRQVQEATEIFGVAVPAKGRSYRRSRHDAIWTGWRLVHDAASAVMPVSQSGGLPTGGLIETGANANGRYARFADGTMICWGALGPVSLAIDTPFMGGFRSISQNLAFAALFAAPPSVSASALALSAVGLCPNVVNSDGCNAYFTAFATQTAASRTGSYTALGRWF